MTLADELFEAIDRGDAARVKEILDLEPALVAVRDTLGDTPLHTAARHGQVGIAEHMIRLKADVNAKDGEGRTPLAGLVETMSACHDVEAAPPHGGDFEVMKDFLVRSGGRV